MKKNFLKKLSFVMALAMTVSLVAPAAGVFAEGDPVLSSASKTLLLGEDGRNAYDFNIKNKPADFKGATYDWSSEKEAVAVVDEVGNTTAVGVGTTKITVVVTKKDDTTVTLDATVKVKDNIAEISTIYMQTKDAPAVDKLLVATDYDFGRTYKTKSGATAGTTSVTRWFVNSDKATVDKNGVFNATEAGTYTITAVAFQSTAKYDAWLALKDTTSTVNVLASKTIDVTVTNVMKEAVQTGLSTAKVTFASATADAASKIIVSKMVGTTPVKQLVKEIKAVDAAKNNEFTITMYVPFDTETTYVVSYPDMKDVSFKTAKVAQDQVAKMEVSTTQAVVGVTKDLKADVKLFNAAGVDITTDLLKTNYVTFSTTSTKAIVSGSNLSMYTLNDTAKVTATFHTYKYDTTTGTEIGAIPVEFTVTCVSAAVIAPSTLSAWTIATDATLDFAKVSHEITVDNKSSKIYVQAVQTNSDTKLDSKTNGGFTFSSSDETIMIVDATGNLYPIKAGSAVIIVKYNNNVFEAVNVTVKAARAASRITLDTAAVVLSNSGVGSTKDVVVKVFDQYDNEFGTASPAVSTINTTQTFTAYTVVGNTIKFNVTGVAATDYPLKVTSNGFTQFINVTVTAPNQKADGSDTTYRIKLSATAVDLAVKSGDTSKSVTVALWGYAPNGTAATAAVLDTTVAADTLGAYRIKVDCPDGDAKDDNASNGTYVLASAVSGSAIDKKVAGNYTVTAYKTVKDSAGNLVDVVIDQAAFTVTNSQVAPVLASIKTPVLTAEVDPTAATGSALIGAVYNSFKITLNGTEIALSDIQSVKATGTTVSVYVESVVVRQMIDGSWIDYTVNINQLMKK